MRDPFAGFLAASLAAIGRDAPACAQAIAATLGVAAIELEVDGERMIVCADHEVVVRPPAGGAASVQVSTTARALLALVDGRDELHAAIIANRVRIRATPREASRLLDVLRRFVEGCARSSAAPALLADYQRNLDASGDRRST